MDRYAASEPASRNGGPMTAGSTEHDSAAILSRPRLVTELIAAQAARRPSDIAVADTMGGRLKYGELMRRSNSVAQHLRRMGAGPDKIVALLLEPTVDLITAMLGVLRAGAAYLPLSPADPPGRLTSVITDSGADAILTTAEHAPAVRGGPAPTVDLSVAMSTLDDTVRQSAHPPLHPDSLAYVIYTSGSTGRPKGVGVTHRNLAAYLEQILAVLEPRPGEVFSMVQPATFDSCLTVLYPALASGGTLWTVSAYQAMDAKWMAAHFKNAKVDYVKITPSHLAALQDVVDAASLMPGKAVLLGGEPSRWSWFTWLSGLRPGCRAINHYGPTETTVGVAALGNPALVTSPAENTPLGPAMRNAEVYVLNKDLTEADPGQAGQIYIGGETVSRGYLNQPRLTAAAFVPDPFCGRRGARMYRTGDGARRRPDGTIEFLGRLDDQIKIRGYRVEPAEAALVLARCGQVADAVVISRADKAGVARLIAYLKPLPGADFDLDRIRDYASGQLPDYLMPDALVKLDSFPLTAHGKLDRSRLPEPERLDWVADAPVTETERKLAGLFADILQCANVNRHDGFFALGGHSLRVAHLISRIRATFQVELPVRLVFESPSVADLAERIDAARKSSKEQLPPVSRIPRDRQLQASYGQQRLWFLNQLDTASPLYNTSFCVRALGEVDPAVLRKCATELVKRHESLRTRLVPGGEGLIQVIVPSPQVEFKTIDLTVLPEDQRVGEMKRHVGELRNRPFDLTLDIPIRALYLRLAEREHLLLLGIHHVATEDTSARILHRDLGIIYSALREGKPVPLDQLSVQYADFAAWQRELLAGGSWDTQMEYWRRQLKGLPQRVELRTDYQRPHEASPAAGSVPFQVTEAQVAGLRALAASAGATLFMVLLAGFLVSLQELTAQRDIAIGTPVAFRPRPELEAIVGYFGNTLVLRNNLDGQQAFRQLLGQVRGTTLAAIAHPDVPFDALVEELSPVRHIGDTPLVNLMLVVEEEERPPIILSEVTFQAEPVDIVTAKVDITLRFEASGSTLAGKIEYRTDLYDSDSMSALAVRLAEIFSAVIVDPDIRVGSLFRQSIGIEYPAASGDLADMHADDQYVAPRTDLERALCELWTELIGHDEIGVTDRFFDVGGHSLLAAQVVQRIKQEYGVSVPLRWCFDQPTVEELSVAVLAAQLDSAEGGARLLNDVEKQEA